MPLPQSRHFVNTGHIVNVPMAVGGTEYSYTLPDHTRKFSIKLRDPLFVFQLCFDVGESGTEYYSIPTGQEFYENNLYTVDHTTVTLYFQCAANAMVAEIAYWT